MTVLKPCKKNTTFLGMLIAKPVKIDSLEGFFAKSGLKEKAILAKAERTGEIEILTGEEAEKVLIDTTLVTDKDLIDKVDELTKENAKLKAEIEKLTKKDTKE